MYIIIIILLSSLIYLILDYFGPKKIYLQHDYVFGMLCLKARDLVVQQYDSRGNLFVTRGMIIYQLKKGDERFTKKGHVPTGFNIFWLSNFTMLRRFTLWHECIEIVVNNKEEICALSAGYVWYRSANGKKFLKSMKLTHYGIGKGRGALSGGIINIDNSTVFFGEYFRNSGRTKVKIYESNNFGITWEIAHEFHPGKIQHIHTLQIDPFSGKLWIGTGDMDKESMIGWSADNYKTIIPIGQGSQIWRVCQLIFTEDAVYWGTDTGSEDMAGIYRWDRENEKLGKIQKINGAILFGTRLAKGTIVMSTDREGFPNEKDEMAKLYIISKNNKIKTIDCGTWNHKKPGFRFSFAKLRFQRDQGSDSVAITCINLKEFPQNDLIILSEDALISSQKEML